MVSVCEALPPLNPSLIWWTCCDHSGTMVVLLRSGVLSALLPLRVRIRARRHLSVSTIPFAQVPVSNFV